MPSPATIDNACAIVREHLNAGRLDQAEATCHAILQALPNVAQGLHMLGCVLYERGRLDEAAALISQAIRNDPTQAAFHEDLAMVYTAAGRIPEAVAAFQTAIRGWQIQSRRIDRQRLVDEYISGSGLEIGALEQPTRVPAGTRVTYVDRLPLEELRRHYPEFNDSMLARVDVVADGETLAPFETGSQDFVIANHFLEHCESPLLALKNMARVLKPGGVLFLSVPDKRTTFDADRPVTTYEHLQRDYEQGPEWSRRAHYEEWVCLASKVADADEAARQVEELMLRRYSIHFHVWTAAEIVEVISRQSARLALEVELVYLNRHMRKGHNEIICVLRKAGPPSPQVPQDGPGPQKNGG